ncbi:citrate synthase [Deinobacterium chartae]|uniref:Citrate synthase n=1 Tax=Deinobacterium chartae TaxID=521158 RepID=A0A841I5K9_9DEIO|nr:citrate/2-methylcitrate synthase [Deinobacterium chartae]MBB6099222.1 citrate synthase [Deinobacterium chartae]
MSTTNPNIAKGLEGIVFTESKLTFINGTEGILTHLGIPIQEWAEKSTFEELSFALLQARLPKADELAAFDAQLKANREIPGELLDIIAAYPKGIHPMQALRTAVSHLGLFDPQAEEITAEARYAIGVRMIAQFATIIAALGRTQEGKEPIAPRQDLTHAGNFLYMLNGTEPTPEQARLFDMALILHADHSMNASTFTAIATASTLSDMYSAITSAIGSLKGPLHGGANEAVMDMLDEIGTVENAVPYITAKLDNKEKIMGVGHRVYKFFDPRSRVLRDYAAKVAEQQGKSHYYQILETIEQAVVERLSSKGIYPNVDFYSGVVYSDLGIKKEYFTPIFALARISGWVASVNEYTANNRLLRPTAEYIGPVDQHYVDIQNR